MKDLNDEATLNFLPLESRNEIWIPDVVLYNTEIKSETLNDEKAFAYVTKRGNYKRIKNNYLQNSYLYEGHQNPITLSRVY